MNPSPNLPVTRNLGLAYALSLVVAVLMAAASVAGIVYRAALYPGDLQAFFVQDAFNLAVGLPLLLLSMGLARRGRLIGLLMWPGMLVYVLYGYLTYLLVVPFGGLFLAYLALVTLSAYALLVVVAAIDGQAVRERLDGRLPVRFGGGVLALLAVFVLAREIALIVGALTAQTGPDAETLGVWIADFAVQCPLLLVGGILLWRRRPLGYVGGAGLLLQYGLLALSVVPILVYNGLTGPAPVDVAGVVVLLAMTALCLVPFALFVRGAASSR